MGKSLFSAEVYHNGAAKTRAVYYDLPGATRKPAVIISNYVWLVAPRNYDPAVHTIHPAFAPEMYRNEQWETVRKVRQYRKSKTTVEVVLPADTRLEIVDKVAPRTKRHSTIIHELGHVTAHMVAINRYPGSVLIRASKFNSQTNVERTMGGHCKYSYRKYRSDKADRIMQGRAVSAIAGPLVEYLTGSVFAPYEAEVGRWRGDYSNWNQALWFYHAPEGLPAAPEWIDDVMEAIGFLPDNPSQLYAARQAAYEAWLLITERLVIIQREAAIINERGLTRLTGRTLTQLAERLAENKEV